ncbi:3-hydroxyacyl-[acyl-carrier-protein] dehydratase [Crossiella equi]|uniref:3-hydroxyacyl-[acyl-carrier-protein] dehydratase n=1 Tax=Crossiella equi TaxID=130796 RepID=A0ABS5AS71_9PSEU|nr:3-hydroxyacyl-ACP dehydratase FabZ family protein [Crossiella equi]MBP2479271.1 3-hydroxyacyl-[acyl-carrier-protein] dehydratase [Crossiella equi]
MITTTDIARLLPHRYPMLLVDQVLEVYPGKEIVAVKAVTRNEPFFADAAEQVTEELVYPVTLLLESWGQSAVLLALLSREEQGTKRDEQVLLGGATGVEFLHPVRPGDVVEHRVRLVRGSETTVVAEGEGRVGDKVVFTVNRLLLAFRAADAVN